FLIGSLATYGQFILHPLHFLQMVEEALPTSRRRARSAVAGKVERKLSWNSVDGAATDDLRTAMESRNIAVGSPVCALLNLIDSSFSTAESALQYMKEASRDRQNVANQPLTADENSFKEQIKKTDGFKRVVPRTRSPTKPHKRSIEDVSTDTNEAQVFHAQYLPRRSRRDAPRSAHPSSSIYTRPTPCSVHRPGISHVISTKSGHRQYNAKNEDEITAGTHTLFKAHTAVRRERSAPARLTDSSSKLITVDKETNADCLATIFPTTRSRKEEGSFSCPQRRLCSSKHISERRRTHKPKRRIQGALVAPKRRAPKHTWRIRKQHLGNIRDGERYCQDYAWKAQKIRRKHERIKTRVGDDTYVHLVSRNIGKKQDTRHHILMAEQGINGAHWLTPNNDQSIAGTKFCQCSPPQTKSISEQSSETSIGSMPRRSLKCLTCDSHKRRHHHSLMKPSSRKSHNSSDPLSRRSVARVTEQCLLSDALPISQHSRKKEECDNIGYEAHSPGISYSSPHILKNEDVRSLQRHSCRERHQLPIPTYCTECGCSYLLAKPCPIRERRSRSGEEFYVQNHMLWDGRSTEDEKNAPGEYHDSGRHPLQRRHECKLGQRCRLGHDYSAHECKTTRLSISPESRWAENTVALNLNKFAKRNEHSHGFGRNGGSMLLRRWPHQHLSVEKMTARTAKPLRIMSARPNSSTLTMLPLTEPPTISTTQSLLEECWELQEMAKPSSNSQSEGYCRCALSQASKLRTVRSGSYNSTSPTYDKDPVMQTSLHSRSILHFKTLKNSCAKCTESAAAEIPHLPRSRPSLIRSRQRLIPTYWRDVRCRSFSEEYITPRSTPPTKTTSETTHMVETVEHCALIRMRSIHSTDVHASSGHLDRMSTTTSSEDVVDKVRPTKHLPKSSHKRLLVPAQPPTFPSSTSPPALYQNPAKIGRVTPWLTKEENSSTSSAFSAASTTALAKRSKSDFHEKRRIRPLEKKQAVLTQNRKMPAKGRNMFPTTLATETKTREDAEPPGNEGKEEAPKEAQKEEPIVNTARLRTPKINLSTAQQMFNLTGKEASPRTGKTTSYRTGRETSTRTARLDNVLTAQQKTPTQASPSAVEWAVNTAYSTSPLTGKEEAPKEAQKEEPIVNTARVRTPKINLSTAQQMSILTGNEASPRTGKTTSYRTGRETSTRTARLENVLTAQQKTPTQASPSAAEWAVNTAYSTSPLTGKEEAPKEAQKEEPIVNTARVRTPKINLSTAQQMSILTGKEASPRTGKTTSYRTGRETSTRTARLDNVLTAQQKTPTQASPSAVEWAVNTAYSTSPLTGKEEAPKEAQKEEPIVNTARVRTPKINLSTAQQMSILTGKEASPRTGKTTSYRTGRETSTRTARLDNVLTAQQKTPTQASPSAVEWAVNTAYSTSPLTGKEEAPKEAQKEEPIVNTARVRTPKINLSTAQQMSILTGKEASPRTGKTTSYRTGRETSTRTARLDNVLTAQQKTPTQASPSAVEWAVNTAYSTSPLTGKEEAPKEAQKEEPIVNTARVRTPKINLSTAQQMSILTGKEASPRTGKTTSYRTGRETSTRTARPANVLTAQEKPPTPGQLCTTRTRATKTSRFFISVPILCTTNTEDKTKVVLHSISTSALLGKNLMIEKKVTPEVTASHTMNREPIKWNHMEKMNSCATKTEKSRLDSPSAVSARSCTSELITAQGGAPSERTILAAVAASFIKEEVATRRKRPSKMSSRHAAANEEIIERTNCPPSHEKPFTCAPPKQAHTRERRWILRQGRHHAYYMPYDAKVVNGLTPDPEVFTSTVRHAHYPEPSMAQSEGYLLSYSRLTGVTKPGTYVKPASGLFTSGANLQRVGRLQPSNDLRSLNKQVDCQTFNFADATSFVCNRPSPAAANVSASRSRKTTSIDLQKNKSLMQPASSDASTCATEKPSLTAYLKGKRLSSATRVINSSLPWQMHGVGNLNMQQPCPAWITKSDVSSFFTIAYSQAVDKNKRLQSHLHKGLGSSCRRRGKRESRARCGHQPENFTLASKNVNGSIRRHSTLAPSPPTRAAQSSAGGSALKKLISLTPAPCKKLRISQDLGKRSDTIEKSSSFASVSKHKQAGAAQSSSTAVYLRHKRELHDHPESEAKGRQLATIHSSRLSTGQYQKSLHASRRRADDAKYRNQSSKIEKNINSDSVGLQPSSRITGRMSISKMEGALTAERSLKFSDKKKLSSFPFNISQQSFHTTGNSHNETFLKHQQNNASYVLGEAASKRKLSLQTSAKDTWFKGKTSTGRAKNVSLRNFNTDGDNDASRGIKQAWKTIAVNRSKTADDSAAEIASNNEEASISGTDSSRFIRRLNEATGCRSSCELRLSVPASPYSRRTISKENVNVENSESVTVNSKGQTTAVADSFELELNDVVRESVIKGRREIDFQIEEKEAIGMKIFIKQIIADERIVIRRITVNDRELCVTAIE
uniref:C3H1-type domain-containing protein n=1 Tax=Parascaris univalens TaxID=6257 RepID=A0A915BUE6_PARUN